ncbi:pyruvate kinase [Anseongella ginsenosidimutans]|uniref:Pyruvate kinase n=1 Tax=Anseongella ginsenosidimutans TaxID=496056 RepID=A0A4R3KNR4_9SPHI|nr:pyruvate kinase [Anseongella ginsenosidimutans]QEC52028.1 pyruvate kinase [Anseongella ginsenosidimutans]TCS85667.1 pyruvate kinase [Anseongella ginsenosidimutans]
MNIPHNRTKIVATIGPASRGREVLTGMFRSGLDIARINFSHGSHQDHMETVQLIRQLNEELGTSVGILADLQGPKIRIGEVTGGSTVVTEGDIITFTINEFLGTREKVQIRGYDQFPKDVAPGELILLDDGKLQMRIIETNKADTVLAQVVHGGVLSSRKGVNLPNTQISCPSLTEKDLADLDFVLSQEVEWIGLSFVRKAEDIVDLKKKIAAADKKSKVVAKIEMPEAIANIDAIIKATDGVMVARGDLGVEIPMEEVPLVQKMIVKKCIDNCRPVIIATQMMESMINTPRPSRAEVNDVANSVLDGADAVMLSNETAMGQFPVLAIQTMQRIIEHIEQLDYPYNSFNELGKESETYLFDSICYSACFLAQKTKASAIIGMTYSGYTAFQLSSHRPRAMTYIFTGNKHLLNALSLVWGVRSFYYDKFESTDQTIKDVTEILKNSGLIQTGDVVINTASAPIQERGRTNTIRLTVIE